MNDREIMDALAARDEAALSALERTYGRLCHAIARGILGSDEDAEECVNDVWLKIWDSIPSTEPLSLGSYAGMITRRLALNRYEARTAACRDIRTTVGTPLDELADILSDSDEISAHLEVAEIGTAVNAFLKSLDSETRVMFVRRYWNCDPISDIAAHMGVREGTVRVRLHRVRRKLHEELERRKLL